VAAHPIVEDFDGTAPDARLRWWNPPLRAEIKDSRLIVATRAETDFWQRTHYGFRADNGHCLLARWDGGDFVLTTFVRVRAVHQYDQAGLIVRVSADCWLKTSVEYEPEGANRLGAVVTNGGWSDWSTQDVAKSLNAVALRVRREGSDYTVEFAETPDARVWSQMRIAHLADGGSAVDCGLYACSPKGEGFVAEFESLTLR